MSNDFTSGFLSFIRKMKMESCRCPRPSVSTCVPQAFMNRLHSATQMTQPEDTAPHFLAETVAVMLFCQ